MDDIACPRCKSTKYRNPNLKLMVNLCGHALCENCIELLFVKGSAACPEPSCGVSLRRANYRVQIFENPEVEKEVDIRRKILRDYNKREEDFQTLREFNDYLEEVEEIIFNLANDIDVEETKRKIEQYKKENKAITMRNKGKLSKEEEYLEEIIECEKQESDYWREKIQKEEADDKRLKTKSKEELIDALMFSDAPAGEILANHAAVKQKLESQCKVAIQKPAMSKFSTGIKLRQSNSFLPVPKEETVPLYKYEDVTREMLGPFPPTYETLRIEGYLNSTRSATEQEKAGGFMADIYCCRALEEAFCGLYCGIVNLDDSRSSVQFMDTS
ncbi:hypothetical protein CHUAL_011093 [Chamberlinius hualienensis]